MCFTFKSLNDKYKYLYIRLIHYFIMLKVMSFTCFALKSLNDSNTYLYLRSILFYVERKVTSIYL